MSEPTSTSTPSTQLTANQIKKQKKAASKLAQRELNQALKAGLPVPVKPAPSAPASSTKSTSNKPSTTTSTSTPSTSTPGEIVFRTLTPEEKHERNRRKKESKKFKKNAQKKAVREAREREEAHLSPEEREQRRAERKAKREAAREKYNHPVSKKNDKKDKKENNKSEKKEHDESDETKTNEHEGADKPEKKLHRRKYILFVGNLSYQCKKEHLEKLFHSQNPLSVRLQTDPKTKKSKGFAFIELPDSQSLRDGLLLHGHSLFGRKINVELTAGGGGHSQSRMEKLKQKRDKLNEQRAKASKKDQFNTEGMTQEEKDNAMAHATLAGGKKRPRPTSNKSTSSTANSNSATPTPTPTPAKKAKT